MPRVSSPGASPPREAIPSLTEKMPELTTALSLQSERLLKILAPYSALRIVTHDNPDPDAIAAGWGLYRLFAEHFDKPIEFVAGGAIVRAENRHMVELLDPPLQIVDSLAEDPDTAIVLVDCGLGTSNHLATRERLHPVAVIDHHSLSHSSARGPGGTDGSSASGSCYGVEFADIRPSVAATATIAASYLREQGIEPGVKLASAMLYAMRTETCGCETQHTELDRSIMCWLTEHAEPGLIAEIENAPLARAYFSDLVLALQGTQLFDDTALCLLPKASGPETVGEVADLLIRCEGVSRVLCAGAIDDDLYVSVRTRRDDERAVELLQRALDGIGGGGGHAHRAGGKVVGITCGGRISTALERQLQDRWLAACGEQTRRPKRLVGLREIVENL
jgi:nanoRNase/pAp phosphatase (c-di-AMP/oligoRNAs hydrolase)